MIKRILIANRGEIAVRIARTCKSMNIEVIAIYSDADKSALHVREADKAIYIGESLAENSYLNYKKIIILNKKKTNNDRKIELNNSILKKLFTNNL